MSNPTINLTRSSYLPKLGVFTPSIPPTLTCIIPPTEQKVDVLSSALSGLALATDPAGPSSSGADGSSPSSDSSPPTPLTGNPNALNIKVKTILDVTSWSIYDVYSARAYLPVSTRRVMACITAPALVQDPDLPAKVLRDANAYVTLDALQGSRVPRFYGLWRAEVPNERVAGGPPVEMFMILLEDVLSDSSTITELLDKPDGARMYGAEILAAVSDMATAGVFPCGPTTVRGDRHSGRVKIGFFDFHNANLRAENANWDNDVAAAIQGLRQRLQVATGAMADDDDDEWEEAEDFEEDFGEFTEDVGIPEPDVVMA